MKNDRRPLNSPCPVPDARAPRAKTIAEPPFPPRPGIASRWKPVHRVPVTAS
jgi:hypothetical protein